MDTPHQHDVTREDILQTVMKMVKEGLNKSASEVEDGQNMLENYGLKTSMTQLIEGFITKPLDSTYASVKSMGDSLTNQISVLVETFFSGNNDIIEKAFVSNETESPLFFFVVLKDDNLENRARLNSFFAFYSTFDFAESFPVYIQYVSADLASRIGILKSIIA